MHYYFKNFSLSILLSALLSVGGLNGKTLAATPAPTPSISIHSGTGSFTFLNANPVQLTVTTTGLSSSAVTWSLDWKLGNVWSTGLYSPPLSQPLATSQLVTVIATSVANPSVTGRVQLTLPTYKAPTLSISPAKNAILNLVANSAPTQFTATLTGLTNKNVTWSLDWKLGSISTIGLYSIPTFQAIPQSVALTASSVVIPTLKTSVEIYVAPEPKSIAITSGSGSLTIKGPAPVQFTTTTKGMTSSAVTWAIDWKLGTISATGLYTPPASQALPTPQLVTLIATSVANPSVKVQVQLALPAYAPVRTFPLALTDYQTIMQIGANAPHPRILWGSNPASLKTYVTANLTSSKGRTGSYYSQLKTYADKVAAEAPVADPRAPGTAADILWQIRDAGERITALGTMWKLTGNPTYLNAGLANWNSILNFQDWSPLPNFLNTAELTYAAAVGFDVFHDQISASARSAAVNTIISKGLNLFPHQFDTSTPGWAATAGNWNSVCNSASLVAILAIQGEIPSSETANIISIQNKAINNLMVAVREYEPDGGFFEGGMYWGYASRYLTMLMSSFQGATGSDLGLGELSNIKKTAYFPAGILQAPLATGAGPCKQTANFGDADDQMGTQSGMFYYALRYNDPYLLKVSQNIVDQAPSGLGLMIGEGCYTYFPPDFGTAAFLLNAQAEQQGLHLKPITAPGLDAMFNGNTGTAALHQSLTYNNAPWVGVKAGAISGHGKLDQGAFTFSSKGVNWILEPGKENYALPGDFAEGVTGRRWTYYRNATIGESTMAFCVGSTCPNSSQFAEASTLDFCGLATCAKPTSYNGAFVAAYNQNQNAVTSFMELTSTPSAGTLVLNLAGANPGLTKWWRALALQTGTDGVARSALQITDTFASTASNCEFIWTAQTQQNVIVASGGQSVKLDDGNGNFVILSVVSQSKSPGVFTYQNVTLDDPQFLVPGLKRITYAGSCAALSGATNHSLVIRIQ